MSVTQQQVVTLLENVLFETPTQATANAGTWLNNSAAGSVQSLAAAMANSGEAKIAATVVGYYLTSLGRAPNAAEVQYYVGIAEQGLTQTQIAAGQVSSATWDTIGSYFAHSPEFSSRGNLDFSLGNTAAYLEAVPWLYQSVLGRTANPAELAYYDAQVVNGTDLGTLFREFTASPEFHTNTDAQIASALASFGTSTVAGTQPPAVAIDVTLGAPTPTPTPSPAPSPAPAPSFHALTTSQDTIDDHAVTGAHTYNAILGTSATLTANDSLTGNGLATLDITDTTGATADVLPSGVVLHGIASLSLTTVGDAGTDGLHPFDVSGVTGLTQFTFDTGGNGSEFFKAGSGIALSGTVNSSAIGAVASVVGGFASLDLTSLGNLAELDVGGTAGAITLHLAGATALFTLDVDGLTLSGGFTDANNDITALTIAGTTAASTIDAIAGSAMTSLTVTGDVTLGSSGHSLNLASGLTTVDLSGDTATGVSYITLHNGSNATVTFGDSDNIVVDSGSANNNTVTFGNGDNQFTANGSGSGGTFTFGTGSNRIDMNSGHASATVASAAAATFSSLSPAPNLIIDNAAYGLTLGFNIIGITVDFNNSQIPGTTLQTLVGLITSSGQVEFGDDGVNTYFVESDNGSAAAGHINIIELTHVTVSQLLGLAANGGGTGIVLNP